MALGLKRSPPAVSPERVALAAAIETAREDAARDAAVLAGVERASDAYRLASRAVNAAEDAIRDAPAALQRHISDTANGVDSLPPMTARAAQEALADAKATQTAARAAWTTLQDKADRIQRDAAYENLRVREAARRVLQAEALIAAQAVAAEVIRLQHEMVARVQLLDFLVSNETFPVVTAIGGNHGKPVDASVREALYRVHSGLMVNGWDIWSQHDGAAVWRAAFEELKRDASAPLPSLTAIAGAV